MNYRYKDFDSYKINENVMNSTDFSKMEIEGDFMCEFNVFEHFPKHKFAIIMEKSKRCYVYQKSKSREKHWDLETLEKKDGIDLSGNSIISTENGQFIKEQYEEMSGLGVSDVIQFSENKKSKKKKKRQHLNWGSHDNIRTAVIHDKLEDGDNNGSKF